MVKICLKFKFQVLQSQSFSIFHQPYTIFSLLNDLRKDDRTMTNNGWCINPGGDVLQTVKKTSLSVFLSYSAAQYISWRKPHCCPMLEKVGSMSQILRKIQLVNLIVNFPVTAGCFIHAYAYHEIIFRLGIFCIFSWAKSVRPFHRWGNENTVQSTRKL